MAVPASRSHLIQVAIAVLVVAAPAVADGINLGFVFCLLIRIFEYVESRLNHRKTQIYLVFRLVCTIFASEKSQTKR